MYNWDHTHKAPQEKTEVKGKLWHWIISKPENKLQCLVIIVGCGYNSI